MLFDNISTKLSVINFIAFDFVMADLHLDLLHIYLFFQSLDMLRQALILEPVMAFPVEGGRYIVDTDASNVAWGAVLSQVQDGQERVLRN